MKIKTVNLTGDTAQPVQVNAMLVEALKELVQEKCDYMLRNKLGNPEIEHTTRQARAALTAAQQAQPERAPLTPDQIDIVFGNKAFVSATFADGTPGIALDRVTARDFVRAIEAAHGIGAEK